MTPRALHPAECRQLNVLAESVRGLFNPLTEPSRHILVAYLMSGDP